VPLIEIESLLNPISDDAPSGGDLRLSSGDITLQTIQEHRTELDTTEDPSGTGRSVNWQGAFNECTRALTTKTKDLELAAWLAEAMAHTEGFPGLLQGIRLVSRLLELFWDRIYPGPDEDGEIFLPIRARPLNWIGSSRDFLRAVGACVIVPGDAGGRPLCWEDYRNAQLVEDRRIRADQSQFQAMLEQGYITDEEWRARLAAAPPSALQDALSGVRECEEALAELRALCDQQFGEEDAPNFVPLGQLLFDIREHLEGGVPQTADAPEEGVQPQEGEAAAAPAAAAVAQPVGPIVNREEALRRLGEVADYFRRTEPHSPISYIVQRAVKWGHMPFESVIQEVVQDEGVLARIWDTLGIQPGGDTSSE
jgi:type VI secretion system protein ImpA